MSESLKKTLFYDAHVAACGRMVDFGGWDMPVQYAGILAEHEAVRQRAGLFDISHMGQVRVGGGGAAAWLDRVLTNHASALVSGTGHYSFLLNEAGGVIDDLFVYRLGRDDYLLVINASKRGEDMAWLEGHMDCPPNVAVELAADRAALAVQGPAAAGIVSRFLVQAGIPIQIPARNRVVCAPDHDLVLASTGYTGEAGVELFFHESLCQLVWDGLLAAGHEAGLALCGLGARNTLRLEMGYPLNGSDLDPMHTPLEAGASWAVAFDKGDFIGRAALEAQRTAGIPSKLIGFRLLDKSPPPRAHYPLFHEGEFIAEATSATLSPSLGVGIGMAYLPAALARPGTLLEMEIRGRRFRAETCRRPFYQPHPAN